VLVPSSWAEAVDTVEDGEGGMRCKWWEASGKHGRGGSFVPVDVRSGGDDGLGVWMPRAAWSSWRNTR